jgi:quercetin dioxygenase-like cupin family protein
LKYYQFVIFFGFRASDFGFKGIITLKHCQQYVRRVMMKCKWLGILIAAAVLIGAATFGVCEESAYNAGVQSKQVMQCGQDVLGRDIVYPSVKHPQVTGLRVTIPAGQETGWHTHSVQGYAYVLSGTLTIEYAGGTKHSFNAGDAFAEVINTPHNGRNAGPGDVNLIVFFTGEAGVPFTKKQSAAGKAEK